MTLTEFASVNDLSANLLATTTDGLADLFHQPSLFFGLISKECPAAPAHKTALAVTEWFSSRVFRSAASKVGLLVRSVSHCSGLVERLIWAAFLPTCRFRRPRVREVNRNSFTQSGTSRHLLTLCLFRSAAAPWGRGLNPRTQRTRILRYLPDT